MLERREFSDIARLTHQQLRSRRPEFPRAALLQARALALVMRPEPDLPEAIRCLEQAVRRPAEEQPRSARDLRRPNRVKTVTNTLVLEPHPSQQPR